MIVRKKPTEHSWCKTFFYLLLITYCLNRSSFTAQAQSDEFTERPVWMDSSELSSELDRCLMSNDFFNMTPCRVTTNDVEGEKVMGYGRLVTLLEEPDNGNSAEVCQYLALDTQSQSGETELSSLMGDGVQWIQSESEQDLLQINARHYQLLKCPNTFSEEFSNNTQMEYLQPDRNKRLYPPSTLDNFWIIGRFEQLLGVLNQPNLFFNYLVNPAPASEERACVDRPAFNKTFSPESYCDNYCPAGFEANSQPNEALNIVNNPQNCRELHSGIDDRLNDSPSEFTFSCTPCGSSSYRYAFPLEDSLFFESPTFQGCYKCQEHRSCTSQYKLEYPGTAIYNSVCDCHDEEVRVIVQSYDVIEKELKFDNGQWQLKNTTNLTARYDNIPVTVDETKNYDFLCVAVGQYCYFNTSIGDDIGFQYVVNETLTDCLYLNESALQVESVETLQGSLPLFLQSANLQPILITKAKKNENIPVWLIPAISGASASIVVGVSISAIIFAICYIRFRQKSFVYNIGGPTQENIELSKFNRR